MEYRDQVLNFIRQYAMAHGGLTPTYAEIGAGTGAKSTSVAFYNVKCLVRDGMLVQHGGRYYLKEIEWILQEYLRSSMPSG